MNPSSAADTRPIRLIVFPGGFNWPVWVARDIGLFARCDIEIEVIPTPGSVFQWQSLADGSADMAITLMDNVIAYHEGQGEAPVVVPDAIAVMAIDARRLPSLVTQPDVASYADLKGRTLSVDAMTTGLALVLVEMLERGGLRPEDYRLERAGGVLQRFEALKRGEHAGALFNAPFDGLLRDLGFRTLATAAEAMPRYQGHVVAARAGWAAAHRTHVRGFLHGLAAAIDWLYDAGNREAAFAIFRRNMPDAPESEAAATHAILFDPITGFPRSGVIDAADVAAMLALRMKHGRPPRDLGAPSAYYNLDYMAGRG